MSQPTRFAGTTGHPVGETKTNLAVGMDHGKVVTKLERKQLPSYRKGKLEVCVLLHPRTVDQGNFAHVLQSLSSEADRQAVQELVDASVKRKVRRKPKEAP